VQDADPVESRQWNYDKLGNRTSVMDTNYGGPNRFYLPDTANEYTQVFVEMQPQIPNPNTQPMYDNRGNLSNDDGLDLDPDDRFVYGYDPENRLTKVQYDDNADDSSGLRLVHCHACELG
jgi:hypothetical protein